MTNLRSRPVNAPFSYANFCRVTSTPEEVFLDIGVNTQPFAESAESVHITQRVAFNYYTAKRMLRALQMAVGRHEETFGRVQMDVRKRVTPRDSDEQTDTKTSGVTAEQNGQVLDADDGRETD